MKNISIALSFFLGAIIVVAGCKKVDPLPYYNDGSVVTLSASKTAVVPAVADSNNKLLALNWTSPNYGTNPGTYKFVIEIDSAGRNFAKPIRREVTGKLTDSITGRDLNTILLNYGGTIGTPYNLEMRVVSSYGNNNERFTSNTVKVAVTPYSDPSILTSTATNVTGTLPTASQKALTFNWTPSFKGYSGVITYSIQYDSATKNFTSPQEVAVGASLLTKDMTQAEINQTALNKNVTGGTSGKIEYRVKAVTAQGAIAYSNPVSITIGTYVPLLRFYLPGSYQSATGNGTDWDPPTAPEFIRDLRPGQLNKLYYMYIYLPANAEFKVTQGRSWNINYGGAAGSNLSSSGGNLSVATAGFYRISIDVVNMKYDIREGRMGFVGDAVGAGWNPPNVFPNYALGTAATNLFVGLTNFTVNGWKLIDNNAWNSGSNTADETRSYGTNGASGSTLEVNGANMPNPSSAGRYRVIWDGRDVNNVKYEMSPAVEMRLVGDGINQAGVNDWDPPTSPLMTYSGNGVWTATVTLKANKEIKFIAGNAWGAFDYEDNSGGSSATGVARKIKWEGGANFKTPTTAGTYTITLNENLQTVTIN
ncbi:MAG: SusE domain-containing protein [Bacteroidota bacterium]|nr:SusE domain-containing protein [Bacteroidota bacterium]